MSSWAPPVIPGAREGARDLPNNQFLKPSYVYNLAILINSELGSTRNRLFFLLAHQPILVTNPALARACNNSVAGFIPQPPSLERRPGHNHNEPFVPCNNSYNAFRQSIRDSPRALANPLIRGLLDEPPNRLGKPNQWLIKHDKRVRM